MDARMQLLRDVLEAIGEIGGLEQGTRQRIEEALVVCLGKYEVQERCTELVESGTRKNYLNMYLTTLRIEGKSPATLEQYRMRLRQVLDFLGKDVTDITLYDLRYFLACYRKVRQVSNSTLDNIRRYIKAFFGWLSSEGHIQGNPSAALKPIQKQITVKREYSQVEMEKIRNACRTKRDIALVEILYATGARVSEISKLNIYDVDFERLEIKVLGKGNKERIVYITERCSMYLREYLDGREDCGTPLFVGERAPHSRLLKPGIERVLRELGKRAGVEDVHPHRYRRTLATDLINRGCNIQDVQQLLGHSSISTTQIYYVCNRDAVRAAYRKYAA